jgi:hypothetical protein
MKTTQTVRHLYARSLAIAVATACVTVVATAQQPAQQPALPPVDRAALERQAEIIAPVLSRMKVRPSEPTAWLRSNETRPSLRAASNDAGDRSR